MAVSPKKIEEFRRVVFSPSSRTKHPHFTSSKKTMCFPKMATKNRGNTTLQSWTDDQKDLIEKLSCKVLEAKMSRFAGFSSPCALIRTLNREHFSCDRRNLSFEADVLNSSEELNKNFLSNIHKYNKGDRNIISNEK